MDQAKSSDTSAPPKRSLWQWLGQINFYFILLISIVLFGFFIWILVEEISLHYAPTRPEYFVRVVWGVLCLPPTATVALLSLPYIGKKQYGVVRFIPLLAILLTLTIHPALNIYITAFHSNDHGFYLHQSKFEDAVQIAMLNPTLVSNSISLAMKPPYYEIKQIQLTDDLAALRSPHRAFLIEEEKFSIIFFANSSHTIDAPVDLRWAHDGYMFLSSQNRNDISTFCRFWEELTPPSPDWIYCSSSAFWTPHEYPPP